MHVEGVSEAYQEGSPDWSQVQVPFRIGSPFDMPRRDKVVAGDVFAAELAKPPLLVAIILVPPWLPDACWELGPGEISMESLFWDAMWHGLWNGLQMLRRGGWRRGPRSSGLGGGW